MSYTVAQSVQDIGYQGRVAALLNLNKLNPRFDNAQIRETMFPAYGNF